MHDIRLASPLFTSARLCETASVTLQQQGMDLNSWEHAIHCGLCYFILYSKDEYVRHIIIQQQQQSFYGPLSGTTQVSRYQKKYSPAHHPDHHLIFITFHLLRSITSSLFKLCAWQSFCTTSLHILFGVPSGLEPLTSYSIHFFTQSVSSFHNTCPYHRNLFCCSIKLISFIPSLSLNSLLGTLYVM